MLFVDKKLLKDLFENLVFDGTVSAIDIKFTKSICYYGWVMDMFSIFWQVSIPQKPAVFLEKTVNIHKKTLKHSYFFSIWVFFHKHSRIIGLQGKGEGISLTPQYHFHPLHRHLDISLPITAETSPLHIASSRTYTGNFGFHAQVTDHYVMHPSIKLLVSKI